MRFLVAICLLLAVPAPAQAQDQDDAALEEELREAVEADRAAVPPVPAAPAASTPRAGSIMNPEIGLIGTFAGVFWLHDREPSFTAHDDPHGVGATVQELEISFHADVDPYFKMYAYLATQLTSIEIEEAYLETTSLPFSLQARGGVFRSVLGRNNERHLHEQHFARRPPPTALLGEDGLKAPGAELSVLLPLPWYTTVTAEVLTLADDPSGVAVVEQAFDLSRTFTLVAEAGGGWLHRDPVAHAHEEEEPHPHEPAAGPEGEYLVGGDVYLKWKPVNVAETYAWWALTAEYFARRDEDGDGWDGAGYVDLVGQLGRRWLAGVRLGALGIPSAELERELVAAASATFAPSEFSRLRLTVEHREPEEGGRRNTLFILQLEAAIGPHAAHPF